MTLSLGGGAVTEVLHDLLCGLALSTVRHDLPFFQKTKKKKVTGGGVRLSSRMHLYSFCAAAGLLSLEKLLGVIKISCFALGSVFL